MKIVRVFLLGAFLLSGFFVQAKTTVHVHFPGSEGHKALLWTYEDLVSYKEIIAGQTQADANGDFTFTLYNKDIIPVKVQVEFFKIEFYVEANTDYRVDIDSVDMKNREFYPVNIVGFLAPEFKIVKPAVNELNAELAGANEIFADFYDSNYVFLYQSRLPASTLNAFLQKVKDYRNSVHSDFVRKHIDIQLVQLKMMLRKTGRKQVVNEFFTAGKILYHDKIYMDFFNSFWSNYLLVSLRGLRYGVLDSVINNTRSYYALTRLIETDPLLKDSVVRELVVLRNMIEMYNNRRFSKKAIRYILSDISANGLTPENKKIAVDIRKMLIRNYGDKAPDFSLPGFQGGKYSLRDFQGKYLYLSVWNEKCKECLAQMDYEKELFLDFDDVINFVSVYVGPDTAAARKVIEKRDYGWTQLYYNEDFMFLKNYRVELFPYYILIDKNGKIEWFKAKMPGEGFSEYFIEMLNEKKGNLK